MRVRNKAARRAIARYGPVIRNPSAELVKRLVLSAPRNYSVFILVSTSIAQCSFCERLGVLS